MLVKLQIQMKSKPYKPNVSKVDPNAKSLVIKKLYQVLLQINQKISLSSLLSQKLHNRSLVNGETSKNICLWSRNDYNTTSRSIFGA